MTLKGEHGYSGTPFTINKVTSGKMVVIVSNQNMKLANNHTTKLSEIITFLGSHTWPMRALSSQRLKETHKETMKGKLLVIDAHNNIMALISRTEMLKNLKVCSASKDTLTKQILVGTIIGTRQDNWDSVQILVESGVDVIVVKFCQAPHKCSCKATDHCQERCHTQPHKRQSQRPQCGHGHWLNIYHPGGVRRGSYP